MKFQYLLILFLTFGSLRQVLSEESSEEKEKSEENTAAATTNEEEEAATENEVEEVDCETQAKQGECQRNYDMWNTCAPNCVKHSKDTWKNCRVLADNERCISRSIEMRRDMHMNCPQTCGYAIAWNFKHREFMKLDKFPTLDSSLGDEPCAPPRGILAAADIMRDRLLLYISGGVDVVKGMNYVWIPDVSKLDIIYVSLS
jgi:hypothetical protein